MRNYDIRLLDRWLSTFQGAPLSTFRPFPGKYPTRILIRVYSRAESNRSNRPPHYQKRNTLFLYNGVPVRQAFQSYEAWKRRYCVQFSLEEFSHLQVNFAEYHQNGIVMAGDFHRVYVSHHHLRVHLISPFSIYDLGVQSYRLRTLNSLNFRPEKVIRRNGASFYVPLDYDLSEINAEIRERRHLMRAY